MVAGTIGSWVSDRDGFGFKPVLVLAIGAAVGLGVLWLLSLRHRDRSADVGTEAR